MGQVIAHVFGVVADLVCTARAVAEYYKGLVPVIGHGDDIVVLQFIQFARHALAILPNQDDPSAPGCSLHCPLVSMMDVESGPTRRVLVFPDAALMSHWGMRHTPCYACIATGDGQVWLLGTTGIPLNLALASAAAQYLAAAPQRLLTWPQMEIGLAEHLELANITLLGPDLPCGLLRPALI